MKTGDRYGLPGCRTALTVGEDGRLYSYLGPVSEDLMRVVTERGLLIPLMVSGDTRKEIAAKKRMEANRILEGEDGK